MENLPEALISDITERLITASDRDSLFLASKKLHRIKADQRRSVRVGCRLNPLTESYLTSLCIRYPNLTKIEISYYGWNSYLGKQLDDQDGWNSYLGKQLDDQGLFILSTNCRSLTDLTLNYCSFITDSGLSHLASCEKLVDLSIVRCRFINEYSLIKLGNCLRRLERLEFKMAPYNQDPRIQDRLLVVESCFRHQIFCESLKEVNLVNCYKGIHSALYFILGSCSLLEKICLDSCIGLDDSDIISLYKKSPGLKSISLKGFSTLTNASLNLKALGTNCPSLENVELAFSNSKYWSPSLITNAILALVDGCSIRTLVLKEACFLKDSAMEALSLASPCLETLEIERAHKVTDLGIGYVLNFPRLANLKITKCYQITDDGLRLLVETEKLDYLMINDCPRISERVARQAAKHVCYDKVLDWLG